jgi:HAD superfamily hydrolase (TIGR01549 family)
MLNLLKIHALSFDLDDTLWPVWPAIGRAEQRLCEWLERHAPRTAQAYPTAQALRELRQVVEHERPDLHHDLSALRLESIRRALLLAGDDAALAEPAFEVFFEQRLQVDLYDDVHPVLTTLAERFPMVALSNGNANVQRAGVAAYFRAALHAREFGVGKPDRRFFDAAGQALDVTAAQLLHIGDDPVLDVQGGQQAGMQTVWLNRDGQRWPLAQRPDLEVSNLWELQQALQPLLQARP